MVSHRRRDGNERCEAIFQRSPDRHECLPGSFAAIQDGSHNFLGRNNWKSSDPLDDLCGQMDEVRVWKVARTEEQIRQTMFQRLTGREPGLAGLWNFDSGTANDATPGQHHGQLKGNARIVAATLPDPQDLPRASILSGQFLNWRDNPERPPFNPTLVRIQQAGRLVRSYLLWEDEPYFYPHFGPDAAVEVQAFDWWGHRWHTNVTLRTDDRIRFDLSADWRAPKSSPAARSEWLADALRDLSPDVQGTAVWMARRDDITLSRDVVEQLVRLTGSQDGWVQGSAAAALEFGKLAAPLNHKLIGMRPALGWLMAAFLAPFALLYLLIFVFDRQNRAALCYFIFATLAALVAWY